MGKGQTTPPLDGITLEAMVTRLQEEYGWEELGRKIKVKCFLENPSVQSSLKFLRRTPWARSKVENLYLYWQRCNRKKGNAVPIVLLAEGGEDGASQQ